MGKLLFSFTILSFLFGCSSDFDETHIEASGTIETTTTLVSSQSPGTVVSLFSHEGSRVSIGDTLLIVDPTLLRIELQRAEAMVLGAQAKLKLLTDGARKEDLSQAKEMLNQALVNFESAKKDFIRFENLFNKESIPQKKFDDAQSRLQVAESRLKSAKSNYEKLNNIVRKEEIEAAKANLTAAKATVDLINEKISNCYVLSPIEGQVVKSYIEFGESVMPGSSLFKISNNSRTSLSIYIAETSLGKVKLGQKAEVFIDSFPERSFPGIITFISPEAEFTPKNIQTKEERTKLVFEVKIEIDNPKHELKTGMPADAVININL